MVEPVDLKGKRREMEIRSRNLREFIDDESIICGVLDNGI